jgi:hypothetical protein
MKPFPEPACATMQFLRIMISVCCCIAGGGSRRLHAYAARQSLKAPPNVLFQLE